MKTRLFLMVLTGIVISQLFAVISYGEEQKQIQVTTKMNFPEKIPVGEPVNFTIDVTYKGPYSWVKNLEPRFEIVPSRATNDINIQYDDSISDFTIWNGHIHTLHGSLQVSEDTQFEAVFLSVSFDGQIRFDEQVVSVDPDSTVSLLIEKPQDEFSDSQTQEEHYDIEIFGLKDKYKVGEEYSFYFVISGYGYSCANYETKYPDESGQVIGLGAEVLCAPETSMHEFEINPIENRGTLGNTGIKNPGTYTVSVTFEKPSKYYPTISSKDFLVVESTKLPPLKQIQSGIKFHNVECNEGLELVYKKADDTSACVTIFTKIELIVRGWGEDDRILLGCTPSRHEKCYPSDQAEYRKILYDYYFDDTNLISSNSFDFPLMHTINACTNQSVCFGEFENGTKIRISCDYPIHGCGVKSFDGYKQEDEN